MDISRFYAIPGEKPLDHIPADGGFCSCLRVIGCVGDSLSSGEFEAINAEGVKTYHDMFEYSWGQVMARMAGNTVYNFSRGGMTAKEYCESFAENNDYWNPAKACQAYIIALGVNDLLNRGQPIGSTEDIDLADWHNNKDTFAGWYGQIVQRLKEIQPEAKFFFMTMPRENRDEEKTALQDAHAKLLYEFAEFFSNSYVLDLRRYGPVYDEEFKEHFYLGGHMNPMGYVLTGRMVTAYIDYIVRHNYKDFKQLGFMGTPYSYPEV